jgi:hypothetical protein
VLRTLRRVGKIFIVFPPCSAEYNMDVVESRLAGLKQRVKTDHTMERISVLKRKSSLQLSHVRPGCYTRSEHSLVFSSNGSKSILQHWRKRWQVLRGR